MLDDGGAYGVGMADAFAAQAAKKGMTVLIRDRLDPLNADYTAVLTSAKSLGHAGAVLWRRSAGRRESGEAVVRHPARHREGRRRRRAYA